MRQDRVLITGQPGVVRGWGRYAIEFGSDFMTDIIYVGITVLFFVVCGLYVRLCEKM